jgi:predicted Zn-dependent protease
MQLGRIDEARNCYEAALKVDPMDHNAVTGLGTILVHQKRYKEALPYAEKAVELNPEFPFVYMNLGHAYLYVNQPVKALAAFEEYARREPTSVRGWRTLLILYSEHGDTSNSSRCFARIDELLPSEKYPSCVDILNEAILLEQKVPHAATQLYEKALALFPKDRLAWYNYGVFLFNRGNYSMAAQAYEEATRISPEFTEAWLNLAYTRWRVDRKQALLDMQQLQKRRLDPNLMSLVRSVLDSPDVMFYIMDRLKAPHIL